MSSLQLETQSNKKWKSCWTALFLFSHTTEWSAFGRILLWHEHLSSSSLLADLSATARYIDFSQTLAGWLSECSVSQPLTVCFPQTYISQNILKPASVLQGYSQSAKPLPGFISTFWSIKQKCKDIVHFLCYKYLLLCIRFYQWNTRQNEGGIFASRATATSLELDMWFRRNQKA